VLIDIFDQHAQGLPNIDRGVAVVEIIQSFADSGEDCLHLSNAGSFHPVIQQTT